MTDYPSEAEDLPGECPQPERPQQPCLQQTVSETKGGSSPEPEEAASPETSEELSANAIPDGAEKLAALEAVLFMAAEPLPSSELAEILEVTPTVADRLAGELAALYTGRGTQVSRVAGGYQIATRPEYGPFVAKLHKPERFRLSRAALETLAIVAYKQPITRPEIEVIRGVNSDSPVDTLSQYELICEVGRKEAPGRPLLYRTTDSFLGTFGLDSVDDLPQLDSIPADEAAVRAEAAQQVAAATQDGEAGEERAEPQPSRAEGELAGSGPPPGADETSEGTREQPA
jgi:segregation and condensation protein B